MMKEPFSATATWFERRQKPIWLILSLLLSALGIGTLLSYAQAGPGASGDSVHYLQGAMNLLQGNGFSRYTGNWEPVPTTGFPPFYSVVLMLPILLGMDLFQGALLLNVALYGANIFLVSTLIYRHTHNPTPALLGASMLLIYENMLHWHSWVMSEALYIFLTLLAIYFLLEYFGKKGLAMLIIAAVLTGLGTLTRYAGISLSAAAGLAILLFSSQPWKRRLRDAALYGIISLGMVGLWMARNNAVAGTTVNRELAFHPMEFELKWSFLGEIAAWFVPRQFEMYPNHRLKIALAVVGVFALWALLLKGKTLLTQFRDDLRSGEVGLWLMALFVPAYLGILFVNVTWLDASTSLAASRRYLLPLLTIVIILEAGLLYRLAWAKPKFEIGKVLVAAFAAFLFFCTLNYSVQFLRQTECDFGYISARQARPAVAQTLQELPEDTLIITNNLELVFIFAERPAYALPIPYDHYTETARADFDEQVALASQRLDEGAVIMFYGEPDDSDLEVIDLLDVQVIQQFYQSTLYGRVSP